MREVRMMPQKKPAPPASRSGGNGPVFLNNRILLSLPDAERASLLPKLQFTPLPTHTMLNEATETIEFAYFINSGLASVLNVMNDGKSVEVGLAGKEGFIGLPLIAGYVTSSTRVVMQVGGDGYKVKAKDIQAVLPHCPRLFLGLNRFSQELGMQATQLAACNRLHEVSERLARWLLMSQDRLGGDNVPLTQEYLAHMLGTRRASVTVAAGALQKAGLITYRHGEVNIRNRTKLKQASCECYKSLTEQSAKWQNETA
jgi:CRP-like cAMP-binding protein